MATIPYKSLMAAVRTQTFTYEEMRDLFAALKERHQELNAEKAVEFKVGDHVKWTVTKGANRGTHTGTITGFSRKKFEVKSSWGQRWRCTAACLTHIDKKDL